MEVLAKVRIGVLHANFILHPNNLDAYVAIRF